MDYFVDLMHTENSLVVRLVPDVLINFLKQMEYKLSAKFLGESRLTEIVVLNALNLNKGNSIPYFTLVELYLVNRIFGKDGMCRTVMERHKEEIEQKCRSIDFSKFDQHRQLSSEQIILELREFLSPPN